MEGWLITINIFCIIWNSS